MNVRPATLADMNACLELDHTSYTDHVWQMQAGETQRSVDVTFETIRLPRRMRVDYPRDVAELVEDWQQGEGFFVVDVDDEICGYVDLLHKPWPNIGWVFNMAVDREHRGKGLGTALMRHTLKWAKDQGYYALSTEATTKNYPALCFYQKLGFKFCGFNDHYYPNQDIALFFVLTLR
jgi:ribosomal protein S18 acetylase RimI-like enzyme